jgi:hypothetical protein
MVEIYGEERCYKGKARMGEGRTTASAWGSRSPPLYMFWVGGRIGLDVWAMAQDGPTHLMIYFFLFKDKNFFIFIYIYIVYSVASCKISYFVATSIYDNFIY